MHIVYQNGSFRGTSSRCSLEEFPAPKREKGTLYRMAQGRVKWYSANLGYGFIAPEGEGEDILVRHEDVAGNGFENLENGARVTYEPGQGREGMEAKNVSRSA